MPQKKSAIKRRRQDEKLNAKNRAIRSRVATAVKKVNSAPVEEREPALRAAVSLIDKAVKVGVIKKATADRKKSRLMKAGQRVS
ncbi:MAG: 30S ribosomal protein S20 [Candidatus Eisenbacteria bacterium]